MNVGCLFQPEIPYYLQRKVRAQNWIALSAALLMPVLVPGSESVGPKMLALLVHLPHC